MGERITKKHQRFIDKLAAQTLPCRDCEKTAYALWHHPTEGGRGRDFFGLCMPCERAFIKECQENVARFGGGR